MPRLSLKKRVLKSYRRHMAKSPCRLKMTCSGAPGCKLVKVVILLPRMPISDNAKFLLKTGKFTLEDYLTAGDDYQLAFTFNRKNIRHIKNLEKKFNLKISIIGELINKKGVFLNNKIIRGSFSHF